MGLEFRNTRNRSSLSRPRRLDCISEMFVNRISTVQRDPDKLPMYRGFRARDTKPLLPKNRHLAAASDRIAKIIG